MGKSSKDKRDAYYRLAKEQGWRARSAFKLIQLDEEFNLFAGVTRVVDLCAAPGSWSQVLSRVLIKGEKFGRAAWKDKHAKLVAVYDAAMEDEDVEQAKLNSAMADAVKRKPLVRVDEMEENGKASESRSDVRIVAIDLQPMSPLEGITMLRADITHPSTVPMLLHALDPEIYPDPTQLSVDHTPTPVDLVISDGAPDVTGLHDLDIYIQSQLLYSALNLAIRVLKPGGKFVAKIFRGKDCDLLYHQLELVFKKVTVAKPRSSRASSLEAFVVCEDFAPPAGLRDLIMGVGKGLEDVKERLKGERLKKEERLRADGIVEVEISDDDWSDDQAERAWRDLRAIPPFLACGDLDAPDADATYRLPKDYIHLDPVQPPTAPPYKEALALRRKAGGADGPTKKPPT